jgi:hypothetical protein
MILPSCKVSRVLVKSLRYGLAVVPEDCLVRATTFDLWSFARSLLYWPVFEELLPPGPNAAITDTGGNFAEMVMEIRHVCRR